MRQSGVCVGGPNEHFDIQTKQKVKTHRESREKNRKLTKIRFSKYGDMQLY